MGGSVVVVVAVVVVDAVEVDVVAAVLVVVYAVVGSNSSVVAEGVAKGVGGPSGGKNWLFQGKFGSFTTTASGFVEAAVVTGTAVVSDFTAAPNCSLLPALTPRSPRYGRTRTRDATIVHLLHLFRFNSCQPYIVVDRRH